MVVVLHLDLLLQFLAAWHIIELLCHLSRVEKLLFFERQVEKLLMWFCFHDFEKKLIAVIKELFVMCKLWSFLSLFIFFIFPYLLIGSKQTYFIVTDEKMHCREMFSLLKDQSWLQ